MGISDTTPEETASRGHRPDGDGRVRITNKPPEAERYSDFIMRGLEE